MTPDVYDSLKHMLLKSNVEHIHLRVAGGEPTLVFDLWEPFVKSMLRDERTTVEILTNLLQVPKDFWKLVEQDDVSVSVSIDNGKSVKVLDGNISEKLSRLNNPWIMTTITDENIDDLEILATFIGINNYGWCLTTDYFEKYLPSWKHIAKTILNIIDILSEFDYDFTKISFNNCSLNMNFSGCRAGNEMFAVNCDGAIYSCQTAINNTKNIGHVTTGYEKKEICTRKACLDCPINGICTGWCPIHYSLPNNICNVIKIFANEVITKNSKELTHAK
jgi:radical SAM protein with 4Fe4S-binding SPASM domain